MTAANNIVIKEGKAEILFSKAEDVFYNPVQEFNRDLSIAAIKTWAKSFIADKQAKLSKKGVENAEAENIKVSVLEALSATGLRSIRYGQELFDYVKYIVANDISPAAVDAIKQNVERNGLSVDYVKPNLGDATAFMYQHRDAKSRFDVIDLDPYGTASPFLDAAVQSVSDGGLLCITCTDLAVLAGKYPETCFYKYGGVPLRSDACHEMALRLVLNALQSSAARYKRTITPLMSCSIDFYVRIFAKVHTSPASVKRAASNTSMIYQCSGCKSFHTAPLNTVEPGPKGNEKFNIGRPPNNVSSHCEICSSAYHMGGPFYSGPIHNKSFVENLMTHLKEESSSKLYGTHSRMLGMTTVISEEIEAPLYYNIGSLCQIIKSTCPPLVKFNSAILNAGYKISLTHCSENSVKTNAPPSVIWDVMRTWAKESNASSKNLSENSPGYKIRSIEATRPISFTEHAEANAESRKIKLLRFEDHTGMNWGPKARAKRKADDEENETTE